MHTENNYNAKWATSLQKNENEEELKLYVVSLAQQKLRLLDNQCNLAHEKWEFERKSHVWTSHEKYDVLIPNRSWFQEQWCFRV